MRNIHTQVDNYMASSPELLEQFILQLNNLKNKQMKRAMRNIHTQEDVYLASSICTNKYK